jgi:aminoglycoside phosphotransferase (APT) family kinase protein
MTDLSRVLERFIAAETGHGAEVRNLTRIPGGFSYETWLFEAAWRDESGRHDERLILRRAPRGGVLEPYDASKEFRVLRALEGSAVPVPRALWVEPSGSVLGTSFYVMEHVAGEIPSPFDKKIPAERRAEMHRAYADALADLHSFDWAAHGLDFLGVPADAGDPAALELDRASEVLDRIALRPYPALREVIEWLGEQRPRCPKLALVHDDYRMGNFIWRDGRIAAWLDWERAFIGDPMADVAFSRLEALAGWCSIRWSGSPGFAPSPTDAPRTCAWCRSDAAATRAFPC